MKKEHFEILLEDISGKFDLIIEGHAALDRKFDRRCDELNEKIEHNSFMLGILCDKVDVMGARLSAQLDDLGNNFAAHLVGAEAHHGMYCVKER